jgi:hypothetical protein
MHLAIAYSGMIAGKDGGMDGMGMRQSWKCGLVAAKIRSAHP